MLMDIYFTIKYWTRYAWSWFFVQFLISDMQDEFRRIGEYPDTVVVKNLSEFFYNHGDQRYNTLSANLILAYTRLKMQYQPEYADEFINDMY